MTQRRSELDGLRGVAAGVVVLTHAFNLVPAFGAFAVASTAVSSTFSTAWWFTHTPLHLIWDGEAAVLVFFVLSGIVLTKPVLREHSFNWSAYYPQRLIRLYLPVWAAVAFGTLLVIVVPRPHPTENLWLDNLTYAFSWGGLAKDATLILGPSGLISPLWTLQYEVLFSLLLPMYIWIAHRARARPLLACMSAIVVSVVGALLAVPLLQYLPVFFVGVMMEVEIAPWQRYAAFLQGWRPSWWFVGGAIAILITVKWILIPSTPPMWVLRASSSTTLIGAVTAVVAALHWPAFRTFLRSRAIRWLGSLSFSLYLVHEPIVITWYFLLGQDLLWVVIPVAILTSLLVAIVFRKFIERPSHEFSRIVKSAVNQRTSKGSMSSGGNS